MKIKAESVLYGVNSAGQCVKFDPNGTQNNEKKGITVKEIENVDIEYSGDQIKVYVEKNELRFSMTKHIFTLKLGFMGCYGLAVMFADNYLKNKGEDCCESLAVKFSKKTSREAIAATKNFMGTKYKQIEKGAWELKD
jgi:hypothetical protein